MKNKPIIIVGASATGKSTIAKILNKITNYKIYSVREHYNKYLVPRYKHQNNYTHQEITRELHHKIADWIYTNDPSAYAKQFLVDMNPSSEAIFESFRIKGDLEYLHKNFPDALFIHLYAKKETRINRKLTAKDSLYKNKKSRKEIETLLDYEWTHFHLQESMDYMLQIGAIMLDTTYVSVKTLELYEILNNELYKKLSK